MKWIIPILTLVISSVYVLINNQRHFLKEGDLLLAMGKPLMAVSMYERALLNYIPFSPYNAEAVKRIEKVCDKLNEKEHKLFCYETLRSSLYQLRGLYIPYGEKLRSLQDKILLIKLELYIERNNPQPDKYQVIYKDLKSMMDYDPYPSTFWSLVVVFSLLGWISAIIFVIRRGFSKLGLLFYLAFFFLWILGLYMA